MVTESEKGSTLKEYIEAEAHSLDDSLRVFQDSLAIIEEVDAVYGLLGGYCESLKGRLATANPEAFGCIVLVFSSCRIQFKLGIVTLLRCHWTDSLMYLRRATEACAIAARIRQHPEFAQVWCNAVTNTAHYEKFKEKFKKLFPPTDALLHDVFDFYDHASRGLHGSPLALKGHLRVRRPSPTVLDLDFNAFDMKFKDEIAASVFYHLAAHRAMLMVFGRELAAGDAAASKDFGATMRSLEARLEAQRLNWQAMFPEGSGW